MISEVRWAQNDRLECRKCQNRMRNSWSHTPNEFESNSTGTRYIVFYGTTYCERRFKFISIQTANVAIINTIFEKETTDFCRHFGLILKSMRRFYRWYGSVTRFTFGGLFFVGLHHGLLLLKPPNNSQRVEAGDWTYFLGIQQEDFTVCYQTFFNSSRCSDWNQRWSHRNNPSLNFHISFVSINFVDS